MKPKPMHIIFWGTVVSLFCAFVVGVVIAYGKLLQDKNSGIRADETLKTGKQTFAGVTHLNSKTDLSLSEIQALKNEVVTLNDQLRPFKQLAKSKYPTLDEEEGLAKLKGHVVELENRANELEKKVRPRTLTAIQSSALNDGLKASKLPIFIASKFMDNESFQFAEQIYNSIKTTGNDVYLSPAKTTIVDFSGIGICSYPEGAYSDGENFLLQIFKKSGILAKRVTIASDKMGVGPNMKCLMIIVGDK